MSSSNPLVWFITGTSSGFGHCLVNSALVRGDRVIATARSLDSIKHFEGNPNVCTRQLDVTAGVPALTEIVTEAAKVWGRIDVVVSNAGVGLPGLMEEGGSALLRRQFEANVFGVMDVLSASLPTLRAQKSGTAVVIGSRSAWKPDIPGLGAYAASKAATHAFTEALTAEVARFNIRVLLVEPGAFRTNISSTVYFQENSIPDYDELRALSLSRFGALHGSEPGDPVKAMEMVVDVVRGEGCAKGRPWPKRLVLGEDAERDVRAKCKMMLDGMDLWVEGARDVGVDK